VGYLVGDWIVNNTKLPEGLWVSLGIIGALAVSAVIAVYNYPRGSYGRENYKYWIGQLGAWFASLLSGGFLPLLKSWVYSKDLLTEVLLVPWVVAMLYLFLLVQQLFQTPRPVKPIEKS